MHRTLACIAFALSLLCSATNAATYVVNTFDVDLPQADMDLANCDANIGQAGDQCTLRAAVMLANANPAPGPHIIVLPLDTTIVLNLAGNGGAEVGDLNITAPMIITGAPLGFPADISRLPLILSSTGERIFHVQGNATQVEFRGLRLSGGNSTTYGGAIYVEDIANNVLIDTVRLSNNTASFGGAVSSRGTLQIVDSDFANNSATHSGAHLRVSNGDATVRRSSFRFSAHAGASREAIDVTTDGRLTLENSMIDGQPLIVGGTPTSGIRADRSKRLWMRNSTLAAFTDVGLNLILDDTADFQIFNSIVAGSGLHDCTISASTTTSGTAPRLRIDDSLIEDFDCHGDGPLFGVQIGSNVQMGVDPLLQPMTGQPGSLVFARRIAFGSPAVDSGFDPLTSGGEVPPARQCLSHDIRSQPRPQDGDADGEARCDMGAVEANTLQSSTFVVNTRVVDAVDANPGDGVCETAPGNGQCTLRAAVMEANAKPGPDVIMFSLPPPLPAPITLTIPGFGGANQGDLDITEHVVIQGQTFQGYPMTTITTSLSQRLFDIQQLPPGHSLTLRTLVLQGGDTVGDGGALRAIDTGLVEIDRVIFNNNDAAGHGGALSVTGGDLIVRDSEFVSNDSGLPGAAVHFAGGGTALIDRSSFWSNQSADGVTPSVLHFDGAGSARLYTSTVHGNSGGVAALNSATVDIRASTLVDNEVFGLRVIDGGAGTQLALRSSIVADNTPSDCQAGGIAMSGGYNLIGDGSCSPAGSNNLSGDPGLAPALLRLRDFSNDIGAVRLPLTGSPVIDAVPATGLGAGMRCLSLDQRQQPRPIDGSGNGVAACDIGAVELSQIEAGPRQFVVNTTNDSIDINPGDGRCDTFIGGGTTCSLRAAIMESNALPGPDSISIPLPGQTLELTIPSGAAGWNAFDGDLDVDESLSITGVLGDPEQRPLILAKHGDRILDVRDFDGFSLRGLRLSGGTSGAIHLSNVMDATIEEVEFFGNSAVNAGGALFLNNAEVTLDRVDIRNNGTDGKGGAIAAVNSYLTLSESSIRSNLSFAPEEQRHAINLDVSTTLNIRNSTISGNAGDGVFVQQGSILANHATIVGNSGYGIRFLRNDGETLALRNSVLAHNSQGGCAASGAGATTVSTNAFNLSQGDGCAIQSGDLNQIEDEPLLGPLQIGSGDFSAYHVPLTGSPLIDSGSNVIILACSQTDQLGTLRPVDGDGDGNARCDIGAIEVGPITDAIFANGFED